LFILHELVDHSLCHAFILVDILGLLNHSGASTFCCEIPLRKLGQIDELFERVLLQHRAQLGLGGVLVLEGGMDSVTHLRAFTLDVLELRLHLRLDQLFS